MSKASNDTSGLSASLLGVGSNSNRFMDGKTTNCHACLSTKATSPEIKIFSDCNINEIHLNIFPPSAAYVKDPTSACLSTQDEEIPRGFLNIDIHEKTMPKVIDVTGLKEERRKVSLGYFSHISLRRCEESILNISIGNSSKITKRHKRNSWIFGRLWRFSHKRKSPKQKPLRWFFSPQLNTDDVHRLSSGSLNFLNDELLISINKKNYGDIRKTSINGGFVSKKGDSVEWNSPAETLKSNGEEDANELDFYMNEIKRRENEMFIDDKFNCM